MTDHETYARQTRLYVFVGIVLGLGVGIFMHTFLVETPAFFRMLWLTIFGAMGGVVGKLLMVLQAPRELVAPPLPEAPVENIEGKFFRLPSGVFTEEQLRTVRVRAATMPMSPIATELPMQVRQYAATARIPVARGVLERLTIREVAERVRGEAQSRAPKTPGETSLALVSYHSEGPLAPDGRSPFGWSLYYVDGLNGLGCAATATDREICLHFHTATTWSAPERWDWVDLEDVLKWVELELPDWAERDVRVRVHLPDDYLVYVTDPLRVADVDIVEGVVRNAQNLASVPDSESERFRLASLLRWFKGGEAIEGSPLAVAVEDNDFANALRTLEPAALTRVAAALDRAAGPALVAELVSAIDACEGETEQNELLAVLAHVPSGLATAALYSLSVDASDPKLGANAAQLHSARRSHEISVPSHPLESLSFLDVRSAMGRPTCLAVPLIASFDPERELLDPLQALGFRVTRRRLLSGDTNLLVGAQLRGERHEVELLLTSTPLPIPCHVLHVLAANPEEIAEQIHRADLCYAEHRIVADLHARSSSRLQRAALYIAALRIDREDVVEALIDALGAHRRDAPLRRAVAHALAVQTSPTAIEFVDRVLADAHHDVYEPIAEAVERSCGTTRLTGRGSSVEHPEMVTIRRRSPFPQGDSTGRGDQGRT